MLVKALVENDVYALAYLRIGSFAPGYSLMIGMEWVAFSKKKDEKEESKMPQVVNHRCKMSDPVKQPLPACVSVFVACCVRSLSLPVVSRPGDEATFCRSIFSSSSSVTERFFFLHFRLFFLGFLSLFEGNRSENNY